MQDLRGWPESAVNCFKPVVLQRFLIFRHGDLGLLVSGHRFQRTSRPSGGLSHALPLRGLVAQVMYGLAIDHGLGINSYVRHQRRSSNCISPAVANLSPLG